MIDEIKLIEVLKEFGNDEWNKKLNIPFQEAIDDCIGFVQEAPKIGEWIPVTHHETTPEDDIDMNEYPLCFDCHMPDDNQEILITTKRGYVEKDVCYIDDGFSLDSGYDWIEDVAAWQALPDPYKPKNS